MATTDSIKDERVEAKDTYDTIESEFAPLPIHMYDTNSMITNTKIPDT